MSTGNVTYNMMIIVNTAHCMAKNKRWSQVLAASPINR